MGVSEQARRQTLVARHRPHPTFPRKRAASGGRLFARSFASFRRQAFLAPPLLEESLAPARVARLGKLQRRDAVGAEMAERLAQLAPGDDDTRALEEGEGHGPDRAPRVG